MKIQTLMILFFTLHLTYCAKKERNGVKTGITTKVDSVNKNKVETIDDGSGTVTIIITKNGATKKITRKKGTTVTVKNGELIEGNKSFPLLCICV